jgi:hypothetical protein
MVPQAAMLNHYRPRETKETNTIMAFITLWTRRGTMHRTTRILPQRGPSGITSAHFLYIA